MGLLSWFRKDATGNNDDFQKTSTDSGTHLPIIHKMLCEELNKTGRSYISHGMILFLSDRWNEPRGTKRPEDHEIISGLLEKGLIKKIDGLREEYHVSKSGESAT